MQNVIKSIQEKKGTLLDVRSGMATGIIQQNGIADTFNGGGIFSLNNIINNN